MGLCFAASAVMGPAAAAFEGGTAALLSTRPGPPRVFAGFPSTGWTARAFDDSRWPGSSGLVVPRLPLPTAETQDRGTAVSPIAVPSGASLYFRQHVSVANLPAARVLELRVTYLDGFVAYLNGTEIARRNLPSLAKGARPPYPHGAEAERVFIPVTKDLPLRAGDNVVAVEVRPAVGRFPTDSNAPAGGIFDAAVFSRARVVRGPYLMAPVDGAVSVAWETDLALDGRVELRDDGAEADHERVLKFPTSQTGLRQAVRLTGLRAGGRYRYRVVAGTATEPIGETPWSSFVAAPAHEAPLRFVVYGDMRAPGHAAHEQVVAGIVRERPAMVLNTGDLVATGSEESAWQKYFEITAPLGAIAPVVPAFGNHEAYRLGLGLTKAWSLFGLTSVTPEPGYTSFDWGGAHFVVLDSNHLNAGQRDWLASDLAAAKQRQARAIFAICHDGPWSHGVHGGSRIMQTDYAPLLAAAGAEFVFGGHDHIYERGIGATPSGPLPYLVVGGGGAPLYTPVCRTGPAEGDAKGLPRCPSSVATIAKTYHYVVVEVGRQTLRLCPKLPDGSPLEPCLETKLKQGETKRP